MQECPEEEVLERRMGGSPTISSARRREAFDLKRNEIANTRGPMSSRFKGA